MSKLAETTITETFDDNEVVAKAPSHLRVFMITLFVAFGGFLFGYDCIIGGQLLDVEKFRLDFGTPQEPTGELGWSDSLRGAFVSILSAGTFFGALTASQFADRLGRKYGLLLTCVIFSIGIAVQTWANKIAGLMVGRCIAGYGVGLVSVMIPLYQGECVPAARRGTMVSCYQLAITVGLLIGQIVVYGTKNMTSSNAYRIPIGMQFAWSGILFFGLLYFPDTPRNLVRIGKEEEAIKAKCRLTGLPPNHPEVREELAEIKGNLQHEMGLGPASYRECFRGLNLRRTLLGVFMQVWQQRIPTKDFADVSYRSQLCLLLRYNVLQVCRHEGPLSSGHDHGDSKLSLHLPWDVSCRANWTQKTPPLRSISTVHLTRSRRNYPCRYERASGSLHSGVHWNIYRSLCRQLGSLCLGHHL